MINRTRNDEKKFRAFSYLVLTLHIFRCLYK